MATRYACSAVEKLRLHPLIEPVTGNTFIIKGGWANGFVFVPRPKERKCVIIDPGTCKSMERSYQDRFVTVFRSVVKGLSDRNEKNGARQHNKSELLSDALKAFSDIRSVSTDSMADSFLERMSIILSIVKETGVSVDAVLATHHHIDHLGVGQSLAVELGVKCFLPEPEILADNGEKTVAYPIRQKPGEFENLDVGPGPHGIRVLDIGGHTKMFGFLLPDGSFIIGDLVGSDGMWTHSVLYMEDTGKHLRSLHMAKALTYDRMLLSHGTAHILAREDAVELVELNIRKVNLAMLAARKNESVLAAAADYLKSAGGDADNIGNLLITARHIGAYNYRECF